jgi:hypothetical protein
MKRLAEKEARLQKESMVENSLSRPATWEAEEIQERKGWGWFPPAPAEEWKLNSNNNLITEEFRAQGLSVKEDGDHILELRKEGKVIARFSQTGVTLDNILKEVESGKYDN